MRKITTDEQSLLSESFGGGWDDLFLPEDFTEYCALSDHHEAVLAAKADGLRSIREQWATLVARGLLREAGPAGFNDDSEKTIQPWERPEISREKVLIEDPEINFLEGFPPKAHASLLSNTLFTTNSALMRYLGPGLAGALKARKNGQQVGNYMEEVRFVTPGRRRNILDPIPQNGKYQRVPLMGAKTVRPVFADKPTPNPNWNLYGGQYEGVTKSRPRDPKAVLAAARASSPKPGERPVVPPSNPNPTPFKGVGAVNGVYVPFAHVIAKLETPLGQPRVVNGRTLNKVGQVQANLEPPDPDDPESYLPADPDTMMPTTKLPFAAQGYKPQALDTSKSWHSMMTQWTKGREENPEMFNQRRLNTMASKFGTTNQDAPGVPMVPHRITFPRAPTGPTGAYRKRGFVPDPNDVTRKVMERPAQYTPDGVDLKNKADSYEQWAAHYDTQGNPAMAAMLRKRAAVYRAEEGTPGRNVMRPQQVASDRGGSARVWDPESKKLTGSGTNSPDQPDSYASTKQDKDRPTPIGMPVRRKKLDNVYTLRAAKGEAISISPELYEEWQERSNKSGGEPLGDVTWEQATGLADDRVFVENFKEYQFAVDKKARTIRATKASEDPEEEGQVDKTPWYWAALDSNRRVLFTYHKDTEVYDIPVYSPGVIDARRGNNPTTLGGFDAAPAGAFEARPPKSKEDMERSLHGENPERGRFQPMGEEKDKWKAEGWNVPMLHAAEHGITMGIKELSGRINKDGYRTADINSLKANKDRITTAATQYMTFNLRNGKAFNHLDGKGVFMNQMHNKREFKTLFAAVRQMDQWQKQNPQEGFDKPMSMMSMEEMKNFLDKLNETEYEKWEEKNGPAIMAQYGDQLKGMDEDEYDEFLLKLYKSQHALFQTKIPAHHVRNDLPDYVAKTDKKGNEIPAEGRGGFQTLNVNPSTLYHLLREARDYYWKFAAKDMVTKIWQAYFKRGDAADQARTGLESGDQGSDQNPLHTGGRDVRGGASGLHDTGDEDLSDAEMIEKMTGGGMGSLANRIQKSARGEDMATSTGSPAWPSAQQQKGSTPGAKANVGKRVHTNLMADFLEEKRIAAQKLRAELTRTTKLAQARPSSATAVAEKVAAEIKVNELDIMNRVQTRLMKKFAAEGLPENVIDQKVLASLGDEYAKEMHSQYSQVQDNARGGEVNLQNSQGDLERKVGDTRETPEEVMDKISKSYEIHQDTKQGQNLARVGKAIATGDPKGIRGLEMLKGQGDGTDEDDIESVVTYFALQHLLQSAPSMDSKEKKRALSGLVQLRRDGIMWDYADAAHQLLTRQAAA